MSRTWHRVQSKIYSERKIQKRKKENGQIEKDMQFIGRGKAYVILVSKLTYPEEILDCRISSYKTSKLANAKDTKVSTIYGRQCFKK
jgi:hypothetical protein